MRNCSWDSATGWMREANLDMTDPTQQCPDGFKLINRTKPPVRTCGRPDGQRDGCASTTFPAISLVHQVGLILEEVALTMATWLVLASHMDFQGSTSGHM